MENTHTIIAAPEKRTCMTVEQMGAELGICRQSAYELARSNGFPTVRIGKRMVIPVAAFEKWLEDQVNQHNA